MELIARSRRGAEPAGLGVDSSFFTTANSTNVPVEKADPAATSCPQTYQLASVAWKLPSPVASTDVFTKRASSPSVPASNPGPAE